jgi:hypothetical protein
MNALFQGRFGEAVAREQQRLGRAQRVQHVASWGEPLPQGSETLVALSSPDLAQLERVVRLGSGAVALLAPVERHVIVGPWFDPESSCVKCFRGRLSANPPSWISPRLMDEILRHAQGNPRFEYAGAWGPLVRACLETLRWLRSRPRGEFTIVDLLGYPTSARFVARHGCECRFARSCSIAGSARFTALQADLACLFAWHPTQDSRASGEERG